MKIKHLQSSSQIIQLGNIKVLTDPWLTDGEYYGSWYHYPPFGAENIEALEYDYIYVSHIHPDHLSERTFRALPHKKPVIIHKYDSKFVKRKLEMLDFEVVECEHGQPFDFGNGGSVTIYAADNCDPEICGLFMGCGVVEKKYGTTQIDTLALFKIDEYAVLNTNDCPYELASQTIKANKLDSEHIDLLLVGYAGAGPYPQCFEFDNEEAKLLAVQAKREQFLNQAVNYINLLRPTCFAPFAGTYVLGGRLSLLTEYRGVPSVYDATQFLVNNIENGSTGIHFEKFDVYDCKTKSLTKSQCTFGLTEGQYIKEISSNALEYDFDTWDDSELRDLIDRSYSRFKQKASEIKFNSDTKLVINSKKIKFQFSVEQHVQVIPADYQIEPPYVRIDVDHNLLHRLLRGPRFAHWNNAEIGSHLKYFRQPNLFERGLYHCMCFFHS